MKIFLLLALVLPACLAKPTNDAPTRIIGGANAARGQFPHQISMQVNGQHLCGGSIISPTKILTAAHCLIGIAGKQIIVVAGITNLAEAGQRIYVTRAVSHPEWNQQNNWNDVAILTLASPIVYNQLVQPITLRTTEVRPRETLTLSGWGYTFYQDGVKPVAPQDLQWLTMPAIDLQTCAMRLNGLNPISNAQVCTLSPAGQGGCMGDSGGPLIDAYGQQVGIVSWGVPCGRGFPDVFASVSFYYNWIVSN